ncbi:thiamine pyrophosphate-dependent enzyme, partial [Natrinema soli]
ALDGALADRTIAGETGRERARSTRAAIDELLEELRGITEPPLTSVTALDAIREGTPSDAIVSLDAGGYRLWALQMFPMYEPRGHVSPGSWATMGTGVPAAIGAKMANPERDVVALSGDGGLLMCVHELHTLADEELDVTVVVLNNSDYAIISEDASRNYRMDEGEYGWEETPVSYTTVAEGLGLEAARAETPDEIESTVADAITSDGPTLVEIPTDPYEPQSGVWMNR